MANGNCGFRTMNKNPLAIIREFYDANKPEIDNLSNNTYTTDFSTGQKTEIKYPKAKIIDMYGFSLGKEIDKANKEAKKNS